MVSQQEAKKFCISIVVATASAFGALFIQRWIIKRKGPKYVSPTIPDFVDIDWGRLGDEERRIMIIKVVMAWPGLLFGNENPWLIEKENQTGATIPNARMSSSFKFSFNRAIKFSIAYRGIEEKSLLAQPNVSWEQYSAEEDRIHVEIFLRYSKLAKDLHASHPKLQKFDLSYEELLQSPVKWIWGIDPNLTEEYLLDTLEGWELLTDMITTIFE